MLVQHLIPENTMTRDFWKAGHPPTLLAAFLYFDIAFMVWVMLGPLGVQIAEALGLSAAQKGMMVATPVLAGALLRFVMGVVVDHVGPWRAGLVGQFVVMGALAWAWLFGIHSYRGILLLGLALGFAGAAFAVALPLASRWYPPQHQGTALGIAGAGNSGTVLAALFAPGLALAWGWVNVFGLALIPLVVALAVYLVFARDAPDRPPAKSLHQYLDVLRVRDAWWFMFFYFCSFGGFVGLASSLTLYFNDQFGMAPVEAGYCTAACVFAGSIVRPMGGMLADRIGGVRTLLAMYALAGSFIVVISFGAPTAGLALTGFMLAMGSLGVGNGAVFQLVPQRFRKEIGVMTGLVGMAGGIGGFYLAASLGYLRHVTGDYQSGLLIFAALCCLALTGLVRVKTRWRATWGAAALAGVRV